MTPGPLYRACLPVVPGRRIGRRLGFRTLNLKPSRTQQSVAPGIYAGWITIGTTRYRAAIHYGPRPFLNDPDVALEAHLLDVDLPKTPRHVTVELVQRLRAIRSFRSERALRSQIAADVAEVRRALPVRAYAFGTFDGIHPGHRSYLAQAKSHGDSLTVVVARDVNVRRLKGRDPEFSQQQRLDFVRSLRIADHVRLGGITDRLDILKVEPIDVVVLGYDQRLDPRTVVARAQELGRTVAVVRAKPYLPALFHTERLKKLGSFGRLWRQTF